MLGVFLYLDLPRCTDVNGKTIYSTCGLLKVFILNGYINIHWNGEQPSNSPVVS